MQLFAAVGALLLVAFFVFLTAVMGAAFGAFSGWVVSLTPFGDWIMHVLGKPAYTLAELGSLLGFAGAFFRSSLSAKKSD